MDSTIAADLATMLTDYRDALLDQLHVAIPLIAAVIITIGVVIFIVNFARNFFHAH